MDEGHDRIWELARAAIAAYELGAETTAELCNVSENHTYRVDDPTTGRRYALRVHRPGYRTAQEIESELTWVDALRADGVVETPGIVTARDGRRGLEIPVPGVGTRNVVLFDWVP